MPVERWTFVASGQDQVINAYKSIERQAARTETKTSKSFKNQSKADTSGLKERQKELRRAESADKRYYLNRERSAKKAAAVEMRELKRVSRVAIREAKAQDRATKRLWASRRRSMGAVGGAALRGIGAAGAVGGLVLGAAARQSMQLRDRSIGIAVKGGRAGSGSAIQNRLQNAALATPGARAGDLASGVERFVSKTGNLDLAMDFTKVMADISVATGTSAGEIGGAMADLYEKFDIDTVEEMSKAMSVLAVQGKRGAFELEDAAKQFPKVAAAAQRFGLGGASGLATLGGLTQIARKATPSGEEAATSVENLFKQLVMKEGVIKSKTGTDVFKDKGKTMTNDIVDVITGTISGGKGNQKLLQSIFGIRGIRAVSPLISEYNAEYQGATGTESDKRLKAEEALRAMIEKSIDATGAEAEIRRDLAANQEQSGLQLTAAWESLVSEVMTAATPAMADLAKTMSGFIRNTDMAGLSAGFMALVEAAGLAAEALGWLSPKKAKDPIGDAAEKRRTAEAGLDALGFGPAVKSQLDEIGRLEDVADLGGGMDPADLKRRLKPMNVTPEQFAQYRKFSGEQQAAQNVVFGGGPTRQETIERLEKEIGSFAGVQLTGADPLAAARRHVEMVENDPSTAYEPGGIDVPLVGRVGAGSKEIDEALQAYAATLDGAKTKQGEAVEALGNFSFAAERAAVAMNAIAAKENPSLFGGIF